MPIKWKGSSLIEVLTAFSLLGICFACFASLTQHTLFGETNLRKDKQSMKHLVNIAIADTSHNIKRWEDGDIYCTKQLKKVRGTPKLVEVHIRCFRQQKLSYETHRYIPK